MTGCDGQPPPRSMESLFELSEKDFADEFNIAKADVKTLHMRANERENIMVDELDTWRSKQGTQRRDSAVSQLPNLARHANALCGEPAPGGLTVLSCCAPCGAELPRFIGLLRRPEFRAAAQAFTERWDLRSRVIFHDDQNPLPYIREEEKRSIKKKPSCLEAHVCLCEESEDGDKRWKLGVYIVSVITKSFRRAHRQLINDSEIFIRIIAEVWPVDDEEYADETGGEAGEGGFRFDLFVYIPLMNWTP